MEQETTKAEEKVVTREPKSGYSPFLSDSEAEELKSHPHCLDLHLSEEDLQFLDDNGYLVVKKMIEDSLCEKIVKESFERAGKAMGVVRKDESTWKGIPSFGIPNLWHLPSLYELRQHPKMYSLFAQLLKTPKLVTSIDRVCMKAPCRNPDASNENLEIHNDLNYWTTYVHRPMYQAGICLEDCPVGGGGFFCLPKMHKPENIEKYKQDFQQGKFKKNPKIPGASKFFLIFEDKEAAKQKIEIPLEKGDVILWNANLPHNGGVNTLNQWRLHAFVRYIPLDGPCVNRKEAQWAEEYQGIVRDSMRSGNRPTHYSTGNTVKGKGSQTRVEVPFHKKVSLTPLGEKLFGEKPWKVEQKKPVRKSKVKLSHLG